MSYNQYPVIEFAGVPGVGKSTIVAELIHTQPTLVKSPSYTLDHESCVLKRNVLKIIKILSTTTQSPTFTRLSLKTLFQQPTMTWFKQLLNWYLVVGYHRSANSITILDQGILQAIWSISYTLGRSNGQDLYSQCESIIQSPPQLFIVLTANQETIIDRLRNRKRQKNDYLPNTFSFDQETVKQSCLLMESVQEMFHQTANEIPGFNVAQIDTTDKNVSDVKEEATSLINSFI
ncbi:AAA family ATPase [Natrononativus amylolyticus]|uniref:AAA family ATPase n=1 Tax=Natrononativus amylolyticus TaxID=2963434 RepID=UPI0020CD3FCE|nr:AAA family ATPase [Natrononativus amylolyticus]